MDESILSQLLQQNGNLVKLLAEQTAAIHKALDKIPALQFNGWSGEEEETTSTDQNEEAFDSEAEVIFLDGVTDEELFRRIAEAETDDLSGPDIID